MGGSSTFTSANYSLQFDAGFYSSDLSEFNGLKTLHTIDGKQARIVKSENSIGINFPLVKETKLSNIRLTFYANCDKKYFDEIEKIFNTISFPE